MQSIEEILPKATIYDRIAQKYTAAATEMFPAHMDYVQRSTRTKECREWQSAAIIRVADPCRALDSPHGGWRESLWHTV